ncbi:MAG TPA: hypothetical protein VMT64_04900 [Candidatus Binataceae bacterium]|nr:hypothetical protein [Candidatus Binataceae bacterium]
MKESPRSASNPPEKSVSARKLAANRANAERSTGPRTAAGKARSSLNALRHGILARAAFNLTIEGEQRRKEFDALIAGLVEEFQPQTTSEHLIVQQLAGCWWRLAKVWRHEQEAAWRMWLAPGMPMEEYNEYAMDYRAIPIRDQIIEKSRTFLPKAGLGDPTIPNGPSASTILRYQNAVSAMLFRCLRILEQRKNARAAFDEAPEETESPDAIASAEASKNPDEASVASEEHPEKHERTQKGGADAVISTSPDTIQGFADASKEPERGGSFG